VRLPGADRAVIDDRKIREYFLSPTHPLGRFKAHVFARIGYGADDWKILELDLRTQHLGLDAEPLEVNEYGQEDEIRGRLRGPNGQSAEFVSVWIILRGEDVPRFVTAYPGDSE